MGFAIDAPPVLDDLDCEDSLLVPISVERLDAPSSGVGYLLEHAWNIGDT